MATTWYNFVAYEKGTESVLSANKVHGRQFFGENYSSALIMK